MRVVVVVMCEMDDECDGGRGHQWMGGVSVDGSFDHDWHFDGFFSFLALQNGSKKKFVVFFVFLASGPQILEIGPHDGGKK